MTKPSNLIDARARFPARKEAHEAESELAKASEIAERVAKIVGLSQ